MVLHLLSQWYSTQGKIYSLPKSLWGRSFGSDVILRIAPLQGNGGDFLPPLGSSKSYQGLGSHGEPCRLLAQLPTSGNRFSDTIGVEPTVSFKPFVSVLIFQPLTNHDFYISGEANITINNRLALEIV